MVHLSSRVVDRHHFDPDPDPTLHFDADPDLDPTPSFTYVRKSEIFWTFIHSSASLQCFIFLTIVIDVIIFNILDSV